MDDEICYSPSLKQKLKSSLCLSSGFPSREDLTSPEKQKLHLTSPRRLKSKTNEFPEIKDKCRHLISRIGRSRRTRSADFRYDAGSYALNFDEGYDDSHVEECPQKNFASRLPRSPLRVVEKLTPLPEAVEPRRISAYS